jgi:hypothetical protein
VLKRFGTLGATLLLICLGIGAAVELGFALFGKDHATRTSTYLPGAIFFLVVGVIYYALFRLLGGWNPATWDGPNEGKKTLLFLLGVPGLIVGFVLLVFWLIISVMGFFEDSGRVSTYRLDKKKKQPGEPETPEQAAAQAGMVSPAQASMPLAAQSPTPPEGESSGPAPLQWQ